ncbi:MFS transporter [Brevibacillus sp. SYSU BS000544]|uniref:MFS transporter n=1 Tax=Brevibacillus sp. SYSU BS000544 TaxID=3416443 RepID=UPI003CE4E803
MITIFVEYKIDEMNREIFLSQQSEWKQNAIRHGGKNYSLLEGVDQPNLFVETFEVSHLQEYQSFKADRKSWEDFTSLVAGGSEKAHVWAFSSVNSDVKG